MRKLFLTATAVAVSFIATAQWKNDEEYVKHNNLFKRKSFNTRAEALSEASKMWGYIGYNTDLDYMYLDEDVPCFGYFKNKGKVYGMIVTKFEENRYDVMLAEHEDTTTMYFYVGDISYGYYREKE